jgi:VWFA-related protein
VFPARLALLLTVAAVHLTAQTPIRVGVDLVTVDVSAFGPDGAPVSDLTPEDLVLSVNGRVRAIRTFQLVRVSVGVAHADVARATLPAPFGSNYVGDAGRTIILIIENESLRATVTRAATDAAAKFVAGLSPRDRVALVTMPRGGLQVDLTRDHAHVRELLAGISGQGSVRTTDSEKSCRTRDTLTALTGLLEGLVTIDVPKTIVFVSSGMLTPRRDAPLAGPPGPCEIQSAHYDKVGRAAIDARANFYVIRPEDFVIDSASNAFADPAASRFRSTDEEMAGLESLAGVTSGLSMRLTPTDHSAFDRIVRETSAYYLLAFDPDVEERNGLSHRVEVQTNRPDVTVRVRPRIAIPRAGARTSTPSPTPQAMLRDGRMYRDLPLRAAAFVSSSPGDTRLKIVAVAEPLDHASVLTSVSFGLIDSSGRLIAQWTANERELSRSPVTSAGLAPPGTYRLRVAAVDSTGRRGATDYEFEAWLTKSGQYSLSALVLGISRGFFIPRLQFLHEPTAMGLFELYGELPATESVSVALEIASTEKSEASLRVPAYLAATNDPARRIATGVVPIASLPPGDYLVRGLVLVDDKPIAQVTHTLRKTTR